MTSTYDLVVIGSGMAGLCAARSAAAQHAGSILLINGEDRLPYKRTKISKNLTAAFEHDAFALATQDELLDAGIDLVNARVDSIEPEATSLTLADGNTIQWRSLILATGANSLHHFPEHTLVVRNAADGDRINVAAEAKQSAIVVGGGVLGIETADQLNRRGLDVTIFSRDERLMQKELTERPAQDLLELVADKGITCHLNATVDSISREGDTLCVHAGTLAAQADLVIECAGAAPEISLAKAAYLACNRGIKVDWDLSTSAAGVFAAGDCVELPDGRIPHLWHDAEDQGVAAGSSAARFLAGDSPQPYPNRPRRLKSEPCGTYLFSLSPEKVASLDNTVIYENGAIYQEFGFIANKLSVVIMTGDKERAKEYEKAVWAELSPSEVDAQLGV